MSEDSMTLLRWAYQLLGTAFLTDWLPWGFLLQESMSHTLPEKSLVQHPEDWGFVRMGSGTVHIFFLKKEKLKRQKYPEMASNKVLDWIRWIKKWGYRAGTIHYGTDSDRCSSICRLIIIITIIIYNTVAYLLVKEKKVQILRKMLMF